MYRFQDVARPAATAAKHFVGTPASKLYDLTSLTYNIIIYMNWRFTSVPAVFGNVFYTICEAVGFRI